MGLGYIGLPTAALVAQNNLMVHGVDVVSETVALINEGKTHIVEPELANAVSKAVSNGYLKASLSPVAGNIYLIVVPTPFKGKNEPDISFITEATKTIIPLLKPDDLYIIESTSPVGTTEKMRDFIYSERPDLIHKLNIAYCPERVLPGNIMYELVNNDRVIGGIDEKSTEKAVAFYKQFVKGQLHRTNARTAEMCKLVENSSRDVQIAFANELSLICDSADIDVWELIALANKHPRVHLLNPGCGVGGHCIAVDPYFIVSDYPFESKLIAKSREINNYKPQWCVEKIKNTALEFELRNNRKPSIGLMGLTFKPDIDDLRESPAKYIVQQLLNSTNGNEYLVVEPNLTKFNNLSLSAIKEVVDNADIIVFLVGHKEFKKLDIPTNKTILDFCGITKG